MIGLLLTLIFGVSDEMRIRKDIKNERAASEKRAADFRKQMQQWDEFKKKDFRKDLF